MLLFYIFLYYLPEQGIPRADIISRIKYGKSPVHASDTSTSKSRHQLSISAKVTPKQASSAYKSSHLMTSGESNHRSRHRQLHQSAEASAAQDMSRHLRNEEKDINNWLPQGNNVQNRLKPTANKFHLAGDNGSVVYKHYYHTNVHDDVGEIPVMAPHNSAMEQGELHSDAAHPGPASYSVYGTRYLRSIFMCGF